MVSLKEFRKLSLEKFEKLPSESSELFKYQTFFKDFESKPKQEELSDNTGFEIIENTKPALKISKMNEEHIERFGIDDKFVQMNNAYFNSGAVISLQDNMQPEGVLRIKPSTNGNRFNKTIIIVGKNSKLNLIKESSINNSDIISEDVLIIADTGSDVTFSELQNYGRDCNYFSNKIAVCGKDSTVTWNVGNFGTKKCRTRTYNFLEGDGSSVNDLQLTFGDKEQSFDTFSNLIHIGKSTTARCLAKGSFKDKSQSIFKGIIKIKEKAKNTNSYLACHGMLLSKDAKANAVPSLEIDTDDVKATHAASVSPIDEEKIFYLVSRGIPEEGARRMITLGYFDPLIRSISSDEIRAKMRYLIEAKWEGSDTDSFDGEKLKEFMTEDAIKTGDIFEGHYKYR